MSAIPFGMIPENKDAYYPEVDAFKKHYSLIQLPELWAIGGKVFTENGTYASVRYPNVNKVGTADGAAVAVMAAAGLREFGGIQNIELTPDILTKALAYHSCFMKDGLPHGNILMLQKALAFVQSGGQAVATFLFDLQDTCQGVADATLKLYAPSLCLVDPKDINFNGAFGALPEVAWVGDTPIDADAIGNQLIDAAFGGEAPNVNLWDKFPLYLNRVTPQKETRILDTNLVRLGAWLGKKVIVMPRASYFNFETFAEGPNIVEGAMSSKCRIGSGSDIGGGASMLGTLSGGNDVPITMGRNCLLEINSILGIPVGDAVIVAAGDRVLAGSRIRINVDNHPRNGEIVKGGELHGICGVTFRRSDTDGVLEAVRTERNIDFAQKLEDGESILNPVLHGGSAMLNEG